MYFAQKSGAATVLITSQKNSLLGKYADFELYTVTRNQFNSVNISSTSMGQLAILQLIQALVKQKQVSKIKKKALRSMATALSPGMIYTITQDSCLFNI